MLFPHFNTCREFTKPQQNGKDGNTAAISSGTAETA